MKLKAFCLILLFNIFITTAHAQVAFSCNDGPFIVGATSSQPTPNLYQINTSTIPFTFTVVSTTGSNISYNAIGYRISDNLIYGIEEAGVGSSSANLVQIDATGTTTDLGLINGLPIDRYISGDFDTSGNYYVSNSESNTIFIIDVDSRAVTNQFSYTANYRFSDLSYNPVDGMLYAISTINTLAPDEAGQLLRIDPSNGSLTEVGNSSGGNSGIGSISFDANGTLYAVDNLSVGVYSINISNGNTTLISTSPAFSRADSAHCANAIFSGPTPVLPPVAVPTLTIFGIIFAALLLLYNLNKTVFRKTV
ncbi:DUF6923 family protein [Marinicella sp. W31]|uniref:DUF6923 family protein n=1 Tax=Marinicella sp. W31 TaxID=3023713 RepID=UPI003757E057